MRAAINFNRSKRRRVFLNYLVCVPLMYRMVDLRDGDQAEFLSRRVEQYEETLRVCISCALAPPNPASGDLPVLSVPGMGL